MGLHVWSVRVCAAQLRNVDARDMQRPDYMWLIFGALMLVTALVFLIYNKLALPRDQADKMDL